MQYITLDDMQWSATNSDPWKNEFHFDLKQTTPSIYMRIPKLKDSVAWNAGAYFYLILANGREYNLPNVISNVAEYYLLSFDSYIINMIKASYNLSSSSYRTVKFKAKFKWQFDYSDQAVFEATSNGYLLMRDLTNKPPTTPSSINLPSTVKGGESCSVSWSASTDPDGNLEGYIVERSYNGGSSWSQIYQGSSTSTSTTIPHGTSTVMFRVCAYDTDGERSGWQTSANKTVLNNRAPDAPSAINVPVSPSGGESVTVTWSAASDPDGNLEGYRLERQWDGKGAFDQVYQGSALSYTDTIPKGEHTSVTYRVRAYDAFGATSGYTTSPARTISNNTAPLIQCDLSGDLGDKSEGFTIPYTVTDAENHAVTVTEKVGGMVKRSNHSVTLGQPNTFQITGAYFQKVRNGKQTAEIIATDAEGKSSTLSLTFTKKVHRASIMLSEPLAVEKEIKVCIIKVLGDIPADATFKVEVANNAGDDAPAWEDATDASKRGINYVFKNKTQVNGWKFGFRVTAERGKSGNGGYITSVQGGFQ